MDKIQAERFKKLIEFLDELDSSKFDFEYVSNECGTVCCAIGWTPSLFPELVGYERDSNGYLGSMILLSEKGNRPASYISVAQELFGIPGKHARALFTPGIPYGSTYLDCLWEDATPQEVAKNMRLYLKREYPQHA